MKTICLSSCLHSDHRKKRYALLQKAIRAGWTESLGFLWRNVPYNTRKTYFTSIHLVGDRMVEHISKVYLEYCGSKSRVWKRLNA